MIGFREDVIKAVSAIPEGKVASYGQIATLIGRPGAARQVGMVLRGLGRDTLVPWQRVINAKGGLSTYKVGSGELQRALLEQEGISFDAEGFCDLAQYRWRSE
jgi:methylated-DNA-protein-cysteine methyltransferase-like protein